MNPDVLLKIIMALKYLDPAIRAALKQVPGGTPATVLLGDALDVIQSAADFFTHPRGVSAMPGDLVQQQQAVEAAFPAHLTRQLSPLPWTEETLLKHAQARLGQ